MEYAKNFDSSAEKMISKYIRKPQIIYGILVLFIALYAAQIAPLVPLSVSKVFNNSYFKVCFMILVLWVAQVSPTLSILIAVLFLMVTNYANNKSLFEMLENTIAEFSKKTFNYEKLDLKYWVSRIQFYTNKTPKK
jgi:cobalamin biosynthesis protein CobD/CbiB